MTISVRNECATALRTCLEIWSPSIKVLELHASSPLSADRENVTDYPPITTIPMTELRELFMFAPFFNASALLFLPKLEVMDVTSETYSECRELARLIGEGHGPCLRIIHIHLLGQTSGIPEHPPIDDVTVKSQLQVLKEFRRVCEPRGITVSDGYLSPLEDEIFGELEMPASPDNDWPHDLDELLLIEDDL
ncbi:hypothetical protein SCHPADRAFT_946370 [Schizopora paradoxa]|uniref:Uncharacterized protein n=1 Tax=Schizopora paradoxa TaxID=27342 RepID=A0A0H2R465_9AGAM|nr:hypothetical protein SCHPADRAFT_946370 [Schizopora paradoxa]